MNIGIITLGQAGGNTAEALSTLDFSLMVINTSEVDMQKFTQDRKICSFYKIGGDDIQGCAMERQLAIDLIRDDYRNIIKSIETNFDDMVIDVFVVIASTGGGTGSGSIPSLCKVIKQAFDIAVMAIVILPERDESIKSLTNTIECMHELEKLKIPILAYDNETVKNKQKTPKTRQNEINSAIVNDLLYIRGDMRQPSESGNIDDREMLKIITEPGVITISHVYINENMLIKTNIDSIILEAIADNKFIRSEEDKVIRQMGVIVNLPKNLLAELDTNFTAVKEKYGEPKGGVFRHIYDEDVISSTGEGTITIICSGLSYPINRISDIARRVNSLRDESTAIQSETLEKQRQSINWMNDSGGEGLIKIVTNKKPVANLDEIDLDIF